MFASEQMTRSFLQVNSCNTSQRLSVAAGAGGVLLSQVISSGLLYVFLQLVAGIRVQVCTIFCFPIVSLIVFVTGKVITKPLPGRVHWGLCRRMLSSSLDPDHQTSSTPPSPQRQYFLLSEVHWVCLWKVYTITHTYRPLETVNEQRPNTELR